MSNIKSTFQVAQSVEHQTCDRETDGVNPGCVMLHGNLGQVIRTLMCVCQQAVQSGTGLSRVVNSTVLVLLPIVLAILFEYRHKYRQ